MNSKSNKIVALGASAGGLDAFIKLLSLIPLNFEAPIIIIQHLLPDKESSLTEILYKKTKHNVVQAKNGVKVKAATIYVIPPGLKMLIDKDGKLKLIPFKDLSKLRMPIDYFFKSLAKGFKKRAIGVILSGTGEDGRLGIKEIKSKGGITLAIDPAESEFKEMSRACIKSACVDFTLSISYLAQKIIELVRSPEKNKPANQLSKIYDLLKCRTGLDFCFYKPSTIQRRVKRRIDFAGVKNSNEYFEYLMDHPKEIDILFNDLLINVTSFFRDNDKFLFLKKQILPLIKKQKNIRVWVPGCSTGEEAYSIAIVLSEYLKEKTSPSHITIFATDVNPRSIDKARKGEFSKEIKTNISALRLNKFFDETDKSFKVKKSIRDLCIFATHDLIKDPPFSKVDIISCHNVLIYLSADFQKKLIPLFHYSLRNAGVLLLGPSESLGKNQDLFKVFDKKHKVFIKKDINIPYDFYTSSFAFYKPDRVFIKDKINLKENKMKKTKKGATGQRPVQKKKKTGLRPSKQEIVGLKERLRTVIEEKESSCEELKSANEEIQSSNEELQSMNEELETAKEELQSTNEELTTLNSELQDRNTDLTLLNNDLTNLFCSVSIPVVMVDNDLKIRRFNPIVEKILKIIPSDIGRPISDLKSIIDLPNLDKMILEVIKTLHLKTEEVQDKKGNYFLVQIRPYRTHENKIDGAVIAFVDITERKQSEKKVRESEEQYRDLFKNMTDAFALHKIILDKNGKPVDYTFLEINDAFEKMTGLKRDKVIEKKVTEALPGIEKDPFDWIGKYGQVALTRKEIRFEQYFDPLKKWYSITAYCPKKEHFAVVFEDITERKLQEEILRQEKDKARSYLNIAGVMIIALNADGQVTLVNKKGCEILGYQQNEIIGKNWYDNFLPERLKKEVKEVSKKILNGEIDPVKYFENPVLTKDGKERLISWNNVEIQNNKGEIIGHLSSGEDITEKRKQMEEIKENENKYLTIFNSVSDMICLQDANTGKVIDVNDAVLKMCACSKEEIIKKGISAYLPKTPQYSEDKVMEKVKKAIAGETQIFEWVYLDHDGKTHPTEVSLQKTILSGKDIILAVIKDISAQKKVESLLKNEKKVLEEEVNKRIKELQLIQEKLLRSERLITIGKLAGIMAHEIRNPLGVIRNSVYFLGIKLGKGQTDEKILKHLDILQNEIDTADKIISDVLDFARQKPPTLVEYDVSNMIKEIILESKIPNEIKINTAFGKKPTKVMIDFSQISQVFKNLISNAVAAMNDKGELSIETFSSDGNITIKVSDTGPGISKENLKRIFEPLFSTKAKGIGLGLSTCQAILDRHNGSLTVESEEGKGATFNVSLPKKTIKG